MDPRTAPEPVPPGEAFFEFMVAGRAFLVWLGGSVLPVSVVGGRDHKILGPLCLVHLGDGAELEVPTLALRRHPCTQCCEDKADGYRHPSAVAVPLPPSPPRDKLDGGDENECHRHGEDPPPSLPNDEFWETIPPLFPPLMTKHGVSSAGTDVRGCFEEPSSGCPASFEQAIPPSVPAREGVSAGATPVGCLHLKGAIEHEGQSLAVACKGAGKSETGRASLISACNGRGDPGPSLFWGDVVSPALPAPPAGDSIKARWLTKESRCGLGVRKPITVGSVQAFFDATRKDRSCVDVVPGDMSNEGSLNDEGDLYVFFNPDGKPPVDVPPCASNDVAEEESLVDFLHPAEDVILPSRPDDTFDVAWNDGALVGCPHLGNIVILFWLPDGSSDVAWGEDPLSSAVLLDPDAFGKENSLVAFLRFLEVNPASPAPPNQAWP